MNPTINCAGQAEKDLALAVVADICAEMRRRQTPRARAHRFGL